MSIVADLTVPADQFILGDALAAAPAVRVEFERIVTHSQGWIMPFLWVSGEDADVFAEVVRRDPTVAGISVADRFDGVTLYRVEWVEHVRSLINNIFDQRGTLVEAMAEGPLWELKVWFDDHASRPPT